MDETKKIGRLPIIIVFIGLISLALWLTVGGDDAKKDGRGWGGRSISVRVAPITERVFEDIVEAIGTAKANESVTLAARVSETVSRISFEDGQIVKKGTLLVKMTSDEEEALLREAKSNVAEAKQQYDRINNLVKRGNASTATLEVQISKLETARAKIAGVQARINDRRIIAPFDGILGLRQVSEGALISPNAPITTIDDITIIKLDFSVPERFIAGLGEGQKVLAQVDAYTGREFIGTVTSVDSRVDPISRTVRIRAEVNNDEMLLRPGMLMTVKLISRSWNALAIPEESIQPTANKNYVYVVDSEGMAERREVILGLRRPGYVEAMSGVAMGDKIVVEGILRLSSAKTKVSVIGASNSAQTNSKKMSEKPKARSQ